MNNFGLLKKYLVLSILLSFIAGVPSSQARRFVVAVSEWPPFSMYDNGKFSGIDFELWREIGRRLNLDLELHILPWPRCLHYMKNGQIDAVSGLAQRPERAKYIRYTSHPYYTCRTAFYVQKGEGWRVKNYADLYRFTIGYVLDSAYFSPFDTDKKLRKHGVVNEVQLLGMALRGHLEIFIGTDCQVDFEIARNGYGDRLEKTDYAPSNDVDLYIGISKKSSFEKDLNRFDDTIKEIIEEGLVEKLAVKYYR